VQIHCLKNKLELKEEIFCIMKNLLLQRYFLIRLQIKDVTIILTMSALMGNNCSTYYNKTGILPYYTYLIHTDLCHQFGVFLI